MVKLAAHFPKLAEKTYITITIIYIKIPKMYVHVRCTYHQQQI